MKEYVTAYAQDKIEIIQNDERIKPEMSKKMIKAINKAARLYKDGYIITDEAMSLIARV